MNMNPLVLSFLCALGALGLIAYSVLDKENSIFGSRQRSEKPISPEPVMPTANDLAVQNLEQQAIALEAETQALKEKLINKERELEKELSTSSGLKSQLEEKINKFASQEKQASELTDKISGLEAQVNEYKTALKSQANTLEELKAEKEIALKKVSEPPAQPGISPEDYNRLKEKLEQAEEVLRILHAADK